MRRPSYRLALVFLVAGCAALLPYLHQFHAGVNDEGIMIASAERVLRGQMPYRDFDMFYPPVTTLATAAWLDIFGTTVTAWRMLMVVGAGLLTGLLFLLADALLERPWSLLPPALFLASGVSEWPVVSYHWCAIAALVAVAWTLVRWLRGGGEVWILAGGVAAGLALATLFSEGLAALAGAVVAMALARRPRSAGVFVGGIALIWIPLAVGLGGLGPMIHDTVWRAWHGVYRYRSNPYSLRYVTEAWRGIEAQWPAAWGPPQAAWAARAVSMALLWTFKYGMLFPILAAAAWMGARRDAAWRTMVGMGAVWLIALHDRLDMLYANYLTPMLYLAVATILRSLPRRRLSTALVIGLFAVNWGVGLLAARQHRWPIHTAAGTLYANDPWVAAAHDALYAYAARHTPPGSTTFAFPYAAAFYPLSRTVNPTRLDFVVPGQHGADQVAEAAAALGTARYVYYLPLAPGLFEDNPAYRPAWFRSEMGAMVATFTRGCARVGVVGPAVVYRRNPDARTR